MNTTTQSSLIKFSQQFGIKIPSPLQCVPFDWAIQAGVTLMMKRDDLLHPIISGNKWRKLCYTLSSIPTHTRHLVSFGGGHSNHLHALGYVCHKLGFSFTALVRGNYPQLTSTLRDITDWGAQVRYLTKLEYRQRETSLFLQDVQTQYPYAYIIPEGGSHLLALEGVAALLEEVMLPYDEILCPLASGGTLAGLIHGSPDCIVTGVAVLKGEGYLEAQVAKLLSPVDAAKNWRILHQFHHGGYAKSSAALTQFCHDVSNQYAVPIEPIYSGKLLWAVKELVTTGYYPRGTRLLLLHTGGVRQFF